MVLAVAATVMLTPTAQAAPVEPPLSYQQDVVATLTDNTGREVPLRRGWHLGGSTGFGWDKAFHKHGIERVDIIGAVLRAPQLVDPQGPTRTVYERKRC